MVCMVRDIPIYYEEYGEGMPILCVHGYGVDHRLMKGCLEPIFREKQGYRRFYFDMPGMGRTPSEKWVVDERNMLEVITEFVDVVVPEQNFLMIGESFGGYMALLLTASMADRVEGLTLLCPALARERHSLPKREVIWQSPNLRVAGDGADMDAFLKFAVIATPEAYAKYKSDVLSGVLAADNDFLSDYFNNRYDTNLFANLSQTPFCKPSCVITGRQDDVVGYADAYKILNLLPRATFAVLDCAGHNLQIDNEPLFAQLIADWIWRVELG